MHSKTFIHQLYAILQDSSLQEWIGWSAEDESVFVLRPHDEGFSKHVLRRYFKHGNVSSFVRQLHMYGFHKISNPQDGSGEAKENEHGNRSSTRWFFTHPLGLFRKDADPASLKKIQRKSTGVGKDGKRKNVLSTVCVNYVGSKVAEDAATPLADRRHYASLPLLPATGSILTKQEPQYQQPLLPHIYRQEHLISKSRTISSPELIQRPGSKPMPSSVPTPVPMMHFHRTSSPLQAQANGPLQGLRNLGLAGSYITPTSSVVSSTSTVASHSVMEYHQRLENNLHLLRKSLMAVADIMPTLFDSGPGTNERANYDNYVATLQKLKDDLITENNSSRIRFTKSSFAGPSTSGTFPGNVASYELPAVNYPNVITPTSEAQMHFKPKLPDDGDKPEEINPIRKDHRGL